MQRRLEQFSNFPNPNYTYFPLILKYSINPRIRLINSFFKLLIANQWPFWRRIIIAIRNVKFLRERNPGKIQRFSKSDIKWKCGNKNLEQGARIHRISLPLSSVATFDKHFSFRGMALPLIEGIKALQE